MQKVAIDDTAQPLVRYGVTLAPTTSLPTTVWRPQAPGPWPLVVFAAGYDLGPSNYATFCSQLASSGYLVAAPAFPLEDPRRGYGLDRADLPNEATDVSFVITTLLAGPLAPMIDPNAIAVVGHSDGADVALMLGYQQGKIDPRVKAIVADAPDPIAGTVVQTQTPLLLVQGNADKVVPYSSSQTVFHQLTGPRYYLTLLGAGHLGPIIGVTPWTPVLEHAVVDFLDAEVAGRSSVSSLPAQLSRSTLAQLQVAG